MMFPSRNIVEKIRGEFPAGCCVELLKMEDPYREMPAGMKGIVTCVDDTGTVFANWENGSTLGVIYGVDKIRRVFKNTQINYLYRDASNYKSFNSIIVSGTFSQEQVKEILSCCKDGDTFIPEQIGWDLVRGWDINEDDHPYAEIDEASFVPTDKKTTSDDSALDVLNKFRQCKNCWDSVRYQPEYDYEEE